MCRTVVRGQVLKVYLPRSQRGICGARTCGGLNNPESKLRCGDRTQKGLGLLERLLLKDSPVWCLAVRKDLDAFLTGGCGCGVRAAAVGGSEPSNPECSRQQSWGGALGK